LAAGSETDLNVILKDVVQAMAADGGGAEIERIDAATVRVRLLGACRYCPSQRLTIERTLRPLIGAALPGVSLEFQS
jgi:Fe-S cluster biogenesis protein NfuA